MTQVNRAVDDETAAGVAVLDAMQALEAESARLGVDIETVVDRPHSQIGPLSRRTYLETAVLVVPTVVGRFVNLPPHALIGRLSMRQDLNFRATFKILAAVVLYPLWWLLVGTVAALVVHPIVGLVAVAGLPLSGYLAARTYGRLRRFWNRSAVRSMELGADGQATLTTLRSEVLNATDRVLAATTS